MRWLILFLFAIGLIPSPALANDKYVYGVFFKGLACYEESKHFIGQTSDEPFIVIFTRNDRGELVQHKVLPGGNYDSFQKIDRGDVVPYEFLVWSGPAQNLDMGVMLWEYNRVGRATTGAILNLGTIAGLAGAVVLSAASGSASAAADAGIVLAELNQDLKRELEKKGADFMGSVVKQIQLSRVGPLGDRPTQRLRDVTYDFYTTHRGNGAHYLLFWEVRRHRVR